MILIDFFNFIFQNVFVGDERKFFDEKLKKYHADKNMLPKVQVKNQINFEIMLVGDENF